MESIKEMLENLNPMEWEKELYNHMCQQTQNLGEVLFGKMDDQLMTEREKGLRLVGFGETVGGYPVWAGTHQAPLIQG